MIRKLAQILAETEAEFNKLPVFARPIARDGFKTKAGQSIADWQRSLAALADEKRPVPPDLPGRLDKLANYYRDVPKETARFTRDAELFQQVAELSRQRIEIIQQIKERIR